jgi:malate synthase
MEDAATAEICRAQVWQWLKHKASMNNGRSITAELVRKVIAEELAKLTESRGGSESDMFDLAARLFEQITTAAEFPEFMTLVSYEYIDRGMN